MTNDKQMQLQYSMLSMFRLCIGSTEQEPPNDEEKQMVESAISIYQDLEQRMGQHDSSLIVCAVAATQLLEEVLCEYKDEMNDVMAAAVCKLTHHGAKHIALRNAAAVDGETVH